MFIRKTEDKTSKKKKNLVTIETLEWSKLFNEYVFNF